MESGPLFSKFRKKNTFKKCLLSGLILSVNCEIVISDAARYVVRALLAERENTLESSVGETMPESDNSLDDWQAL